jgi:RNA polymerase sigma-70 factor (ECF subfamily)
MSEVSDWHPAEGPEEEPGEASGSAGEPALSDRERSELVARLFKEHNTTLVRFLTTRLHSVSEAKEVAQEAYVRVLQLDKPGASNLLRAYLFRVALNLAIDRIRRRKVQQRIYVSDPDLMEAAEDLCDPERYAVAREDLMLVARSLTELPEKCLKAFLMYRLEGETQARIAERLGITDRTVNSYVRRAMLYCRLRLEGVSAEEAKARLSK